MPREEEPVRREPEQSFSTGGSGRSSDVGAGGTITSQATRSERIHEILDDLIRQRQSLRVRGSGSDTDLLEANRRSIVYWQTALSRALLAEHGGPKNAATTRS
jgi:hypothetical protein